MAVKIVLIDRKNRRYGHLWLKESLVRCVPEGALFEPELTEEGILFRFIGFTKPSPEPAADLPAWAANGMEIQ